MRLFIAALVSPELRAALSAALDVVRADLSRMPVKWVAPMQSELSPGGPRYTELASIPLPTS